MTHPGDGEKTSTLPGAGDGPERDKREGLRPEGEASGPGKSDAPGRRPAGPGPDTGAEAHSQAAAPAPPGPAYRPHRGPRERLDHQAR